MNRHQRRAAEARKPKQHDAARRADAIIATAQHIVASDASGATLMLPDGSVTYISAEAAREMLADDGRRQ